MKHHWTTPKMPFLSPEPAAEPTVDPFLGRSSMFHLMAKVKYQIWSEVNPYVIFVDGKALWDPQFHWLVTG